MKASRSEILAALQRGLPLAQRPFEELSRGLGCAERDLVDCAAESLRDGTARRFGAVFDARRLGFKSALCCANAADPDAAAALLVPRREVTHCYLREARGCPNLWWTWSAPAESFERTISSIPIPFRALPAARRYKIDVIFGGDTLVRDESVEDDLPPPSARERAIIKAMQGDTEVRPDYFAAQAAKTGMNEWDLLSTLEIWRRRGRLRRIGLVLDHRKSGYAVNGMCCFRICGDTAAAGRALAARNEVTHCYERPACEEFPYNLFAMVHCASADEAESRFAGLKECLQDVLGGMPESVMLISTVEYKKTSMTFWE